MVVHGFLKPTSTNPMLYVMNDQWEKEEMKHKYDNMFFLLLDSVLNKDFYKFKIRLNPTPEPSFQSFMDVLQQWIMNINLDILKVEAILLNTHYKYANLSVFGNIKVIVIGDPNTSKLLVDHDICVDNIQFCRRTFSMERTNWECLFMGLFNCKVCFQLFVYLCDQDVFFVALRNSTHVPIFFEVLFRIWPIHGNRYRSALDEGYIHEDFDVLLCLLVIQSSMWKH